MSGVSYCGVTIVTCCVTLFVMVATAQYDGAGTGLMSSSGRINSITTRP